MQADARRADARQTPYSLYLHIPFCIHRCGYCDFNTYAGLEDLIPAYVTALCQEIEQAAQGAGKRLPVHTIFFGGGTPSLLPALQMEQILSRLRGCFDLDPQAEISLEANPGTLSPQYLLDLRQMGFNRISLGVQSANPGELRLLERQHDFPDVIRSVSWARQAGFDNLNLDLIFGLPEQSLGSWQHSLELVLGLGPEHLSLYALTLEHGTPFGHWARRGLLSTPDPDRAAEMYEWASQRLEQEGYTQYEISNWARGGGPGTADEGRATGNGRMDSTANPAYACRHNLQYWRNQPYLGLGAGAHGYAAGQRTVNSLVPAAYIQRFEAPKTHQTFPLTAATQSFQEIDRQAEIGETMMMGLRLVREGVSEAAFQERFGQSLVEVFPEQIRRLSLQGLLEWQGQVLRLTNRARLLGNRVFMEFL
jgi:oxygen-independent coproporphyrinogen III oxidase